MRRVSVPGKVMLAGEYSVLEPGNPCLVAAVERRVFVEAEPAARWTVETGHVRWTEGELIPPEVSFVVAATQAVQASPHLIRTSDQLHTAGHKLGLGGSAAVTVGTVAATPAFRDLPRDR